MSNRLTAKDYKRVLIDVVSNGYHHIQAINNEIQSMKIEDPKNATQEQQDKLRALTLTMTLVNDLIHPAHILSKSVLKGKDELIDYCVRMQKIAFENKLVDECFCSSCKEPIGKPESN
jgi:hypothetical protein